MHGERCFKEAVFVSTDVAPKRLLISLRSSVGEITKYSQDVFVFRSKELSVVKEVFRKEKGDFILSDGRSETNDRFSFTHFHFRSFRIGLRHFKFIWLSDFAILDLDFNI